MAGIGDYIFGSASANSVDPQLMARIAHIESGGNPGARTGSYKGLFQLSDNEFNKYGGGDIYNPADNSMAYGRKLAAETDSFRQQYGRDPSATEIYLIHQQGPAGFAAHNANPDQPAWMSMASTGEGKQKGAEWAKRAIWGNIPDNLKAQFGSVDNVSSQAFMDLWRNKVEGTPLPTFDRPTTSAPQGSSAGEGAPLSAFAQAFQGNNNNMADEELSLFDRLRSGGPGALFGAPNGVFKNADGSDGYDLAAAIGGVGASLAGVTNPAQANAIMAGIQPKQKPFKLVAGADGTMYKVNEATGKVENLTGPKRTVVKIGTGPMGDIMGLTDGRNVFTMDGQPVNSGGASGVGSMSDAGMAPLMKDGVSYDPSRTGMDRVQSFKPEYAADIMRMYNGESMPTGKGDHYTQFIKREAGLLGDALGQPFSEQTFKAKQTALNDVAKGQPTTIGGQATLALTALDHIGEVINGYQKIGNYDLSKGITGYIPGSSYIANVANAGKNSAAVNAEALNGLKTGLNRYAEESTKYYAGTQAAQAERERIHSQFGENLQPTAAYGALKQERNLMADKFERSIQQLTVTLGDNNPAVAAMKQHYDQALAKVDAQLEDFRKGVAPTSTKAGTGSRPPLSTFIQ